MMLIAHRGNTNGPKPELENSPEYIEMAIENGFSVEVDLWVHDFKCYLGHDKGDYLVDSDFLLHRKDKLWIHCKNREAFTFALKHRLHCFWHDQDDYTMTSWSYVWAYPGKEPVNNLTVLVMPEREWTVKDTIKQNSFGICSDFVDEIRDYINK